MRQITSRGVKKWVITLFCCLTVVFINSIRQVEEDANNAPIENAAQLTNGQPAEKRLAINPKHLAHNNNINIKEDVVTGKPNEPNCICQDSKGNLHDLCYRLPANRSIHGARFNCQWMQHLEDLGFLSTEGVLDLSKQEMPLPAFVTAYSLNHAHEGKKQIEAFRKVFPTNTLVVYDLGLSVANIVYLKGHKNLEVRKFPFEKYPAYFKTLNHYRWKPLIIAEALREFGSIFYMDSSIRFMKGDLSHVYDLVRCRKNVTAKNRPPLKSVAERDRREATSIHESGWDLKRWEENKKECRKAGYMMHGYTGHGILAATHSSMYNFIPTDMAEIIKPKAKMYEAGFIFAVRTEDSMNILKWYVLCALEEFCMVPPVKARSTCAWAKNDKFTKWANCHRCVVILISPDRYFSQERSLQIHYRFLTSNGAVPGSRHPHHKTAATKISSVKQTLHTNHDRYDQSAVNLLLTNEFWYDRTYYASEIVDFFQIWRI